MESSNNLAVIPLFIEMPHKKMEKVNRMGLFAKCDCGHEHKFNGNDIDLDKSDSITAVFKSVYTCPECKTTYNGIYENHSATDAWYRRLSPIGTMVSLLLVIGLMFGSYKVYNFLFDPSPSNSDINTITNKELEDFMEWDQNKKKTEWENQPVDNN